jgi:hypothetical protein
MTLPETPDLVERFRALPPEAKKRVHRSLCARALEAWERFAAANPPLTYSDSVIGMAHTVETDLPAAGFRAAFAEGPEAPSAEEMAAVAYRYGEPIVALQDEDLELPDHVLLPYYAIYNAFEKYARGRAIDDWLIVNQALSATDEPREWLDAALREA